jgi:hypothetical protein
MARHPPQNAAKGKSRALKTHRQRPEILIGTDGVLRSEPPNGPSPQASEVVDAFMSQY